MQAIALVSLILAGIPRAGELTVSTPALRLSLPSTRSEVPNAQGLRRSSRDAGLETLAVASSEQPTTTHLRAMAHARDFVRFGQESRAVTPLAALPAPPPEEPWPSFATAVQLTSSTGLPCVVRLELAGKDGATLASSTRGATFQSGGAELVFRWPSLQPVEGPLTLRVLIDGRLAAERALPVSGSAGTSNEAAAAPRKSAKRAGRRI